MVFLVPRSYLLKMGIVLNLMAWDILFFLGEST